MQKTILLLIVRWQDKKKGTNFEILYLLAYVQNANLQIQTTRQIDIPLWLNLQI